MKNIFNLLLTGGIFWVGNEYFNEYISISDNKTLIIATFLMFAIGYLYALLMMASVFTIPIGIGCFTTIILVFGAIILTPIKLWILNKYLVGFNIDGFWTYAILTCLLSMFSISLKSENKE